MAGVSETGRGVSPGALPTNGRTWAPTLSAGRKGGL